MKSNKKAFTIVELVIVIAVIAILAAVLIPTFSNLIKRSKVSADQQLIRNLNSALRADLKDHKTMTDALAAAEEFGYNVSKINKSATDNEILWDSKNDVFCYFESDKGDITYIPETTLKVAKDQLKDVDYWVIAKAPSDKYSTYLYNYTGTGELTVTTGLDVGNETITSITYVGKGSAQSVTIRTTGGTLTVNAPDDEVTHYEFADVVSVINVATASYHENGTVKFLEVTAGHIVLEKDAKVTALHFTATEEKFENAQGKQISIDLSKIAKDNLPSFSRDAVTIATDGTFVAKVTSDSDEFIWLFGSGVKERMVVVSSNAAIAEGGELKAGITAGCETGSVAEQIANPAKRNAQGELVKADGVTLADADNPVFEKLPSKADVQTGATLFAGGSGTQSDPFLIVDYDTFQHVSDLYEEGYYYFKVKEGIDTIDCKNWRPVFLYGSIDGNGVTLNNLDKWLFDDIVYGDGAEQLIKDMTVNCRIIVYGYGAAALCDDCLGNVTFENVNVNGYIEGRGNSAVYVAYGSWGENNTLRLKNCGGNATLLVKQNGPGIYMGHHGTKTSIILEDCNYSGVAYTPNGKAYTTADYTTSSWASFTEIENGVELAQVQYGKLYANTNQIAYNTEDLGSKTFGDNFEITASGSSSYAVAEFMIAPNGNGVTVFGGGYTATYMSEELALAGGKYATSDILYYHVAINPSAVAKTGLDVNTGTFNVVNSSYNNTYSSASVMITEYDTNNNVIAVWVWSLPVE